MSARMPGQTENCSVLFVDISDSTGLYERLGDDKGRRVLSACIDLLKSTVQRSGGTIVDQIGDELMCTYPDALSAARAATDLQCAVIVASSSGRLAEQLNVRIGFHYGPLIVEDGRIFGDTVHVARRVASASKAQQILTTASTLEQIPAADQLPSRFVERTHVKGKSEPIDLTEIVWDPESATAVADEHGELASSVEERSLVVEYKGQSIELGVSRPTLTLGRGEHCDLVCLADGVSRLHARFEYRKGEFFFVDQSTNGSRVVDEKGVPHFVRRAERSLRGEGSVVLGPAAAQRNAPVLCYRHAGSG